jgi:hypothetical protein
MSLSGIVVASKTTNPRHNFFIFDELRRARLGKKKGNIDLLDLAAKW